MNAPARIPTAETSVTVFMAEKAGMMPEAFEATVRRLCMPPHHRTGQEASREEFAAFVLVCKHHDLNPLTREIFAMPQKTGGFVPVVSIDGWLKLVNRHPQMDGMEFEEALDDKGGLISVTCRIYRKDRRIPISVTEYFAEVKRNTDPWRDMPHRMLRHKAMIQCARYAFGFAGIFDEDEAERIVAAVDASNAPPPAPPIDLPDMRRAAAVIEHKPAAPAPAPEQPAAPVPRAQAQAAVSDSAAAASNSDLVQRAWSEVLAEIQGHLDGARTVDDVADIRALYADEEAMLSRSDREAFDYAFEQAENRVSKPVEPVEAPNATKEPAEAEAAQAGDAEDWAAYESRITRLAKATHDQAGADGLRKVWKAGKDYRALMEQRKAATREQRVALTAVVQDAIKRAEAPAAPKAPAAAPTVPGVTAQDPEAVRACGAEIFGEMANATTREQAYLIWARSAVKREDCGASPAVLQSWEAEYKRLRKLLPEAE